MSNRTRSGPSPSAQALFVSTIRASNPVSTSGSAINDSSVPSALTVLAVQDESILSPSAATAVLLNTQLPDCSNCAAGTGRAVAARIAAVKSETRVAMKSSRKSTERVAPQCCDDPGGSMPETRRSKGEFPA